MEKARDDISSYYIVGYYSTNGKMGKPVPGNVKVVLSKEIQAKIDYRGGYFGDKVFAKFTAADKENQLQSALMLGDPVTDLELSGEVDYFRLARDRYFIPFSVKIPGSEIALAKAKGNAQTEFDFIAQVRDTHDKIVSVVRDGIKIKLSEQSAAELTSRPIAYDTGFTLPPGKYTLKFLARESETRKDGNVRQEQVQYSRPCPGERRTENQFCHLEQSEATPERFAGLGRQPKEIAGSEPSGAGRPENYAQHHACLPQGPEHVRLPRGL